MDCSIRLNPTHPNIHYVMYMVAVPIWRWMTVRCKGSLALTERSRSSTCTSCV
ncbi:hypothetical protein ACNKHT_16955 [Shigella flexneri]